MNTDDFFWKSGTVAFGLVQSRSRFCQFEENRHLALIGFRWHNLFDYLGLQGAEENWAFCS